MKIITIFLLLTLCWGHKDLIADPKSGKQAEYFFVGTYTDSGSEGIYNFSLDPVTGKLTNHGVVAKSDNPSFLALTPMVNFCLLSEKPRMKKALEWDMLNHLRSVKIF